MEHHSYYMFLKEPWSYWLFPWFHTWCNLPYISQWTHERFNLMDFAFIHVLIRSKATVLVIKVFWFLLCNVTNKHFIMTNFKICFFINSILLTRNDSINDKKWIENWLKLSDWIFRVCLFCCFFLFICSRFFYERCTCNKNLKI